MRIAIIGTHGVGKTTLARSLSSKLGIPLIDEQIRTVITKYEILGFKKPDDIAKTEWYRNMVLDTFLSQLLLEKKHSNQFITDRTTLDYYSYYKYLNIDDQYISDYLKELFLNHYMKAYDIIIYIPIMFPLNNDSYRNIDESFRNTIDIEIKKLMRMHKSVFEISTLDRDNRTNEVLTMLQSNNMQVSFV